MTRSLALILLVAALHLEGCGAGPRPGTVAARRGDELLAAGDLVHAGTRVVLWIDPGGYDAYRPHCRFRPDVAGPSGAPDRIARYGSLRGGLDPELGLRVREQGWKLADLRRVVRQVVIHYDECGTSRRCFEVLHDIRGLSCHFLLDLDGTVYQTLDLKERAWHAGEVNDVSIGIEIAHPGAHTDLSRVDSWYVSPAEGARIRVPESADRGALTPGLELPLARGDVFRRTLNGRDVVQREFTEAQYRALESLLVALCRTFPRIAAAVPRDSEGRVLDRALPDAASRSGFAGLVGHWHVSTEKVDPGPAFDWERVLSALRRAGIADR